MNIKCPNCNHNDELDNFFEWRPDSDGHPTIDVLTCPECLCSNRPYRGDIPLRDEKGRFVKYPNQVDLDDFVEIEK